MTGDATLKELTANMYGKKFWVAITRAVKTRDEVMKQIEPHLRHQIRIEKEGVLFGAGPLTGPGIEPGGLGLVVIRADSEAEARKIFDADPLHVSGARAYELYQWTMNEGRINLSIDLSDKTYVLG